MVVVISFGMWNCHGVSRRDSISYFFMIRQWNPSRLRHWLRRVATTQLKSEQHITEHQVPLPHSVVQHVFFSHAICQYMCCICFVVYWLILGHVEVIVSNDMCVSVYLLHVEWWFYCTCSVVYHVSFYDTLWFCCFIFLWFCCIAFCWVITCVLDTPSGISFVYKLDRA